MANGGGVQSDAATVTFRPDNWRARPPMPAPSREVADAGSGWDAIDAVSVDDVIECPFAHVQSIDNAHHVSWACATVDVYTAVIDAFNVGGTEGNTALDRALKWQLVYHQVLLRLPPRGGRRGAGLLSARFRAWHEGDFGTLLRWWRHDRAVAISAQAAVDSRTEPPDPPPMRVPGLLPPIGSVNVGMGRGYRPPKSKPARLSPILENRGGGDGSGDEDESDGDAAAGDGEMPELVDCDADDSDDEGNSSAPVLSNKDRLRKAHRARHLTGEGELSRAVRELCSLGMGDLSDPDIAAQLRDKHPTRDDGRELPDSLLELAKLHADYDAQLPPAERASRVFPKLEIKLKDRMRRVRRLAGTGVMGFRNEYIKALSEEFTDVKANSVSELIDGFAGLFLNGELPAWYHYAAASVEECAPIKKPSSDPEKKPDCRPVGKGECLPRMIHSAFVANMKPELHEELWPLNVGTATRDGCGILATGIRLATELRPDFVAVKIDVYNAHNELRRLVALHKLARSKHCSSLTVPFWAHYGPRSRIYFRGNKREVIRADFDSEEAMRQGCPLAQAAFNISMLDDVAWLDGELGKEGGFARFNHDDGYAFGPAEHVFRLVLEFEERIHALGLALRLDKCECYSHALDLIDCEHRPAEKFPVSVVLRDASGALKTGKHIDDERTDATDDWEIVGRGLVVAGIPIGSELFVDAKVGSEVSKAVSKCRLIDSMLRDECQHTEGGHRPP